VDDAAQQILALTRVVSDADAAQPGKPVTVEVLPGFSGVVPSTATLNNVNLNGALGSLGALTGAITGKLDSLVAPVTLTVTFAVKRDGQPVAQDEFVASPPIGVAGSDSDPLNVAFLLRPPLTDDTTFVDAFNYEIDVKIHIAVEGLQADKTVTVPVVMPPIEIPALCLLSKHTNFDLIDGDDGGSLVVMVRASSQLRELGTVVATINKVMGLLKTVKSVLDLGSLFLDTLGEVATLIGMMPTVYFSIGNIPDLDDNGISFEDDASALLVIGLKGTQVTLFSDEGFDTGGIDEEHSTFTVNEIMLPGGVGSGIGMLRMDSFGDWQTDAGDNMNDDTASVRWGKV
jgi:hypothetical protein